MSSAYITAVSPITPANNSLREQRNGGNNRRKHNNAPDFLSVLTAKGRKEDTPVIPVTDTFENVGRLNFEPTDSDYDFADSFTYPITKKEESPCTQKK